MVTIDTDEDVSDAVIELIQSFADALIDQDELLMREVMDMVHDKMSGECVCLEEECICGSWL
jgi:hypothetical protein